MMKLEVIHKLHAMKDHTFYLTGSRYFGNATEDSDWDFFVQFPLDKDSLGNHTLAMELRKYLESNGFKPVFDTYYGKDRQTLLVMRNDEAKVDIQFVEDVKIKLGAQYLLKHVTHDVYHQSSKHARKSLWNATYTTVKTLQALMKWRIDN